MTNHLNRKHHNKSILLLALALTSCDVAEDKDISKNKGISYARAVKPEVHNEYLACYALDKALKSECISILTNKYIHSVWKKDEEYIKSFQFEAEKQGFKNFLNNQKLPCESINEGPTYDQDKESYLVKCKPNHQYFMQYDYDSNQWKLIKENENER